VIVLYVCTGFMFFAHTLTPHRAPIRRACTMQHMCFEGRSRVTSHSRTHS
jgi:hypothetical protein